MPKIIRRISWLLHRRRMDHELAEEMLAHRERWLQTDGQLSATLF